MSQANEGRSAEAADFFTLGYTGRKLEELLDTLIASGVRTLLDIRQNAVSMYRPELSKGNLQQAVEARGLQYVHAPELGVPRDIRAKAIATGSRDVIWTWYDKHVAEPYLGGNLHRFLNSVEHPVALMCAELDPAECHRHRLSVMLEAQGLQGFDL
jgi:uncharacterized protein (DUF488 family)